MNIPRAIRRISFQTAVVLCLCHIAVLYAAEPNPQDYRVLATSKTSTMQKEMNEAADAGYSLKSVMGGESGFGGKEVIVVMGKDGGRGKEPSKRYLLLATKKTSTAQKEMQQAAEEGFEYKGQTVFSSTFGGKEVAIIMERDLNTPIRKYEYRLLATSKTSTMQKELLEVGEAGFMLLGMTLAETSFAGNEVVCILRRLAE